MTFASDSPASLAAAESLEQLLGRPWGVCLRAVADRRIATGGDDDRSRMQKDRAAGPPAATECCGDVRVAARRQGA
jgi:hypothetical protein